MSVDSSIGRENLQEYQNISSILFNSIYRQWRFADIFNYIWSKHQFEWFPDMPVFAVFRQ